MLRMDICFIAGETISIEYPSCGRSIDSIVCHVKKRALQPTESYDMSGMFSVIGDTNDIIVLQVADSSFMYQWDQWVYDIRATDADGNTFFPFYGMIYHRDHRARRDI